MDLKVVKQINKNTRLEFNFTDEDDMKEALVKAQFAMEIPYVCGACGSEKIKPVSVRRATAKEGEHKGEEFIYVESYCFDCCAKRSSGEYKNPKGAMFWKGDWAVYQKPNGKVTEE
jgi:hypothetical protein